jgi:hypothetical protein
MKSASHDPAKRSFSHPCRAAEHAPRQSDECRKRAKFEGDQRHEELQRQNEEAEHHEERRSEDGHQRDEIGEKIHAFCQRDCATEQFDADLSDTAGIVQLRHGHGAAAGGEPELCAGTDDRRRDRVPIIDEEGKEPDEENFAKEGRHRRFARQCPLHARERDGNDDQRIQNVSDIALDEPESGARQRKELVEKRIERCRIHTLVLKR